MSIMLCKVCDTQLPDGFTHSHHTRPQATGGSFLDEIPLCPGCHNVVHIVENMLRGTKASLAEDSVRQYYANEPRAQKRCMALAIEAAKWFQMKKSGQLKADPNEEVEFMIKLPIQIKLALQSEGNTVKDPKTGRKVGTARLAASIVSDWVLRKYPALRKGRKT